MKKKKLNLVSNLTNVYFFFSGLFSILARFNLFQLAPQADKCWINNLNISIFTFTLTISASMSKHIPHSVHQKKRLKPL